MAAAYVLGRLSNKELIAAPRSEFVYVALLQRPGLERKYRLEAMVGLAQARHTDELTELIGSIGDLDRKGAEREHVIHDLGGLLLQSKPSDLQDKRVLLEKLATEGQLAYVRQLGWAAQVTAEGSADAVWRAAESNPVRLADLVGGIPGIVSPDLRATFYAKLKPILDAAEASDLRRAAVTALPSLPGHGVETANTLAGLVLSGVERDAAVETFQRVPREFWPKDKAGPLVESLIASLQGVPAEQRTSPAALSIMQLATDLALLLPPEKAAAAGKTLRALGVSVFAVRTIKEQMLYDKTVIVVEAGKPVEVILINDDAMPHNLVVVAPGALTEIGEAAEKMGTVPDEQGRLYIPNSPKVLHATKLVEPGHQARLGFNAPELPGDYPYLCTFPAHWRRMTGTLIVVQDVEAYLASHPASSEPKLTEWKLEDLSADLERAGSNRNLAGGRELFTKLSCRQCHKIAGEGYAYGPDLTEVFKRWKGDRTNVLVQILEPSKVIEERYRPVQFDLKDGDDVTGFILKEDDASVTIQTGASDTLIQTVQKSDTKSHQPRTTSMMPAGLLNSLSKEQILDLLSYLESGGVVPEHEHPH